MATANVQIKKVLVGRGNTATITNYPGVRGEIVMNTDTKTLHVHDGVHTGGFALATEYYVANLIATAGGVPGPQGNVGATGAQGPQGPAGAQGLQGIQGNVGPQGIQGNVGPQGIQGIQGNVGATGATGPQGIQGNVGATGAKGDQGTQGIQGNVGPQGIQGNTGATGAQGPQGATGATGATGPQGIQGNVGATGPQGPQGATGAKGDQGIQGIQGNTGAQGVSVTLRGNVATSSLLPNPGTAGDGYIVDSTGNLWFWNSTITAWADIGKIVGPEGPRGQQGIQGNTGPQGIQGIQGNVGATGPQGIQGNVGATGPQGIQGIQGNTGATGPQGIQGNTGATGPQGIQGIQGNTGATGPQGIQGNVGATGPQGPQGIQGNTGAQGPQGIQGNVGPAGAQGATGAQGIQGNVGPQGPKGDAGSAANTGDFVFTYSNVSTSANANIRLTTNGNTFVLGRTGNLLLPNNMSFTSSPAMSTSGIVFGDGSFQNTAYTGAPVSHLTLRDSTVSLDGGSNTWGGGVSGATEKAGFVATDGQPTLFTFSGAGGAVMSAQLDGSLFVGDVWSGGDAEGVQASYDGWIVASSGIKSRNNVYAGGDLGAYANVTLNDSIVFTDGTSIAGANGLLTVPNGLQTKPGQYLFIGSDTSTEMSWSNSVQAPNTGVYSGIGSGPDGTGISVASTDGTGSWVSQVWQFGMDGNLTIPGNINYANGRSILSGITAGTTTGNALVNGSYTVALQANGVLTLGGTATISNNGEFRLWSDTDITVYKNGQHGYAVKAGRIETFTNNGRRSIVDDTGLTLETGAFKGNLVNFGQNNSTLAGPAAGGASDRIRLWDFNNSNPSHYNYAIGAEADHVWFTTDHVDDGGGFKFYGQGHLAAKIGGAGTITLGDNSTGIFWANGDPYSTGGTTTNTIGAIVGNVGGDVANGRLWYDTNDGRMYVRYSGQWVDANPTVPTPTGNISFSGDVINFTNGNLTVDTTGTTVLGNVIIQKDGDYWVMGTSYDGGQNSYGPEGIRINPSIEGSADLQLPNNDFAANTAARLSNFNSTGNIELLANNSTWKFDYHGNIVLPTDGHINYANGSSILTGITAGTGGNTITTGNIIGNNTDPNVYIETTSSGSVSTWTFGTNGVLTLPANTAIIQGAGADSNVNIVSSDGTTTATWHFDKQGNLTLPTHANINYANGTSILSGLSSGSGSANTGNIAFNGSTVYSSYEPDNIYIDTAGGDYTWTFGTDGTLSLPGGGSINAPYSTVTDAENNSIYGAVLRLTGEHNGDSIPYIITTPVGTSTSQPGRSILVQGSMGYGAGAGYVPGGNVTIAGGYTSGGTGAKITVHGGGGEGDPGPNSGNVDISAGWDLGTLNDPQNALDQQNQYHGYYQGGKINFKTSRYNDANVNVWSMDVYGNLTLPAGGTIGENGSSLVLTPTGATSAQQLKIYPTMAEGDHLHLTSGDLGTTSIFLGSDSLYVRTRADGAIVIGTDDVAPDQAGYGYRWVFDGDGTTTFPDHKPVTITGNLTVGNLTVNGNTTTINTQSYTVVDNIIQIATDNPADTLDLGFVAHRTVGGTLQHTGLVRDASTGIWELFSNVTTQPGNTVDFTQALLDDLQLDKLYADTVHLSGTPPSTVAGAAGDLAGDIHIDSNYLYYCTTNWTASSYTVGWDGATSNTIFLVKGDYPTPQVGWIIDQGGYTFTIDTVTDESNWRITYTGIPYGSGAGGTATLTNPNPPAIWKTVPLNTFKTAITGTYSNANVASYLVANPQSGTYSNANVAAYLTTGATVANLTITGNVVQQSSYYEKYGNVSNTGGNLTCNFNNGTVFYANLSANVTANFTNVNAIASTVTGATIIVDQGATAYRVANVQVNGVNQTVKWVGATAGAGTAGNTDVMSFSFIHLGGGAYRVLGQISNYG